MLSAGQLVGGRFEIERAAKGGGMGMVYCARDLRSGTSVAVKVALEDGEAAARFERECTALAKVSPHPGIVGYIEHGRLPTGGLFLAMEWVDGVELRDRLHDHATVPGLPIPEVLQIGRQLATTLAHVHAKGFVHRDVKPSNVMLRDGSASALTLLDFGAVRPARSHGEMTRPGVLIGSPWYMSPEQVLAEVEVGPASDIFSLATVLYECLTGEPPFKSERLVASLARILLEEPPRLHDTRPEAPSALAAMLARAFAKDPAARPSADEVLAILRPLAAELEDGASTVVPTSTRSIGVEERRVRTLLLWRPGAAAPASSPSLLTDDEITKRGVRIDALLDGSGLAYSSGSGTPIDEAGRLARVARAQLEADPRARIAIATGRSEGTSTAGALFDRVASLVEAAKPGTIELDALTATLLSNRFELGPGHEAGTLGSEHKSETQRTLLGRPMPILGRRRELAILEATLAECEEERVARVVMIQAEPGIGKTRLASELLARILARATKDVVLRARGELVASGSPFALLAGALREATGITDGRAESARARLDAFCDGMGLGERAVRAGLGALVGVEVESDKTLGPAEAFVALVERASRTRTVVLVLDDLQWSDNESLRSLDAMLASHHDLPIFVLALARPSEGDQLPALFERRGVVTIRLEPLTAKAATELVQKALPAETSAARMEEIVSRAGGNAFFLEELIRWAAEGREGLPDSVLGTVEARLETLGPETRRALRAASVFGETFWVGGVEHLLDARTMTYPVNGWMDDLVAREILTEQAGSRISGQRELRFRHAIVRDAAYATLTEEERVLAHATAGRWLESAGFDDMAVLARHAREGNEGPRAMQLLLAGAKRRLRKRDT